jgi:hypothetical protein
MVKVLTTTPPHADQGIGLAAGRNEFVSFQVVVQGADSGAKGVSASFAGLDGPSHIGGTDVTLYREAYLNITTPSTPDSTTGMWPDGLIPDRDEIAGETRQAFPFDVPAGEARAIWADIHVPNDAKPGVYKGTVKVTGGNGVNASVAVTLSVINATLPSTPSLTTAFRLFNGNVCEAHTGANDCGGNMPLQLTLMNRYQQMALEHRITLANTFVNQPVNGDWSAFDTAYGPFLDGSGPGRLAGAKMTSAEYCGQKDATDYAAFAQHFRAKGWFDRAYDYTADEPPYGSSYQSVLDRSAMVHGADPQFRTLVTNTAADASNAGVLSNIDVIVPVVNYIDGVAAPYLGDQRSTYDSFLQTPGKQLWLYQSCMSHGCAFGTNAPGNSDTGGWPSYMVDASAAKNRAMEWVSFNERATGELYYETAEALPSAWTDQYQFAGNGDGTLFYPGTTTMIGGQTDVPVASIRLKQIRNGVQDYEWLHLVSKAGDDNFAHQVALAAVPNAYSVSDDGSVLDRARLQLMSRYLEITQQPPATPVQGAPPAKTSATLVAAVQSGSDPVSNAPPASSGSGKKGGCSSVETGSLSVLAALSSFLLLRRKRRPQLS